MTVIGLTGGIASGKSTAASYLESLGACVIDADRLGHLAYEPGRLAHTRVIEAFGNEIVGKDGSIDRRILGGKVFGDREQLQRLTDIVWPEIRELAEAEIRKAVKNYRIVVLEAAVLLEADWDPVCDEVWVLLVEPMVARQRAAERDGLAEAEVQQRIDAQLGNDERRRRANRVLDNNGEKHQLLRQLDAEWRRLMEAA